MKFCIISILLLSVIKTDALGGSPAEVEQEIAQQNLSDQLTRGVSADGFVNETRVNGMAMNGMGSSRVVTTNGVQSLVGPTQVRTQRVNIAPRYVTERVTAKPRIITENIVQPIYQRTINRPSVVRETIVPVPQYNRAETQTVNNKPVVQQTQYRQSTRTRNVTVPGNQIHIQPVVQPKLLVRQDVVRVRTSQPQVTRHPAQVRPVQTKTQTVNRVVNVPGRRVVTRQVIQPVVQRENVNVQVQRGPSRNVNHKTVYQQPVVQNRVRNQRVVVPGNSVITQPIIQPIIRNQTTQVRFQQGAPQQRTNQAIVRPSTVSRSQRTLHRQVVHTVPVERVIPVRRPYIQRVAHVREVHVPVDERGVEITPDYVLHLGGASADITNNTNVHVHHEESRRTGCGHRIGGCGCAGGNCGGRRQNWRVRRAEMMA